MCHHAGGYRNVISMPFFSSSVITRTSAISFVLSELNRTILPYDVTKSVVFSSQSPGRYLHTQNP